MSIWKRLTRNRDYDGVYFITINCADAPHLVGHITVSGKSPLEQCPKGLLRLLLEADKLTDKEKHLHVYVGGYLVPIGCVEVIKLYGGRRTVKSFESLYGNMDVRGIANDVSIAMDQLESRFKSFD